MPAYELEEYDIDFRKNIDSYFINKYELDLNLIFNAVYMLCIV